ncbi:MAG: toxic anion resistance protein [Clostridiales bacterium]|nr:toxic anion resistance protein [Clostridiales bacterium]
MTDINNTPATNEVPFAPATTPSFPTLTLEPAMAQQAAPAEQTATTVAANSAAQAAAQAVQEIDTSMLTEEEKRSVEEFVDKIDVNNTDHVLLYGADAQKKISDFSESALQTIRTKDTGEVGNMLVGLVNEIKGFGAAAEKPSGIRGLFWDAKKAVNDMQTKYQKVDANVDVIATQLEKHQVQLLKDVSMFNHLYDMNTQYFKELTMYIIAGEKKLQQIRGGELADLSRRAAETGDAMDAQKANDLAANCDRFEKKLHDLKLTRQVALQMAPQIRLLQNNDSLLVERIQSTLSNTLPLWKSQIVIALGMHRSQEALKAQSAVTDMTNELLKKNAEALKVGTIQTAKEAERGIIDLETLKKTNQDLMDTISEVMRVQQEGRSKRLEAEREMAIMEGDLKKKLLEMH